MSELAGRSAHNTLTSSFKTDCITVGGEPPLPQPHADMRQRRPRRSSGTKGHCRKRGGMSAGASDATDVRGTVTENLREGRHPRPQPVGASTSVRNPAALAPGLGGRTPWATQRPLALDHAKTAWWPDLPGAHGLPCTARTRRGVTPSRCAQGKAIPPLASRRQIPRTKHQGRQAIEAAPWPPPPRTLAPGSGPRKQGTKLPHARRG